MTKLAVFVGSLRQDSYNKKLAHALERVAPADVEFHYVDSASLPLLNQDLEANFPEAASKAKEIVESADGVLFVTPEYNRGIPGVLKNAIDWVSRPGATGTDSFSGKPAGIVGCTTGTMSTGPAQMALRPVLLHVNLLVMGQPTVTMSGAARIFDEQGNVVDEKANQIIAKYMDAFTTFVTRYGGVA